MYTVKRKGRQMRLNNRLFVSKFANKRKGEVRVTQALSQISLAGGNKLPGGKLYVLSLFEVLNLHFLNSF